MRRCAVGWQSTPGVSASQQQNLEQTRREERVGEQGLLSGLEYIQYHELIARCETYILFTYPQSWDALRLQRVEHLGSDFSRTLDELDAEFRNRPGIRDAWAIADPHNLDPLEEIADWSQFEIFKGFTNSIESDSVRKVVRPQFASFLIACAW